MSKKQTGTTSDIELRRRQQKTRVRPSNIMRSVIQAVGEEALQPNDLKRISKSVYRFRRKQEGGIPGTFLHGPKEQQRRKLSPSQ